MKLTLITGQAGTGKTYKLLAEIADKSKEDPTGSPLILLVPEQASFNYEWTLLDKFSIAGSFRARVCGFRKLFDLLANEQNIQLDPWLNDWGKSMILRKIVNSHAKDFTVFRKVVRRQGFVDNLRLIMDEFFRFGVSENALTQIQKFMSAKGENPIIAEKLFDISLVYREYLAALNENYCDETKLLHILASAVEQSNFLRDVDLYIDGFTDFDPAQIAIVKALIKKCRSVTMALIISENKVFDENSVFAFPEKTYKWLTEFVDSEKITFEHIHLQFNYRFSGKEDLQALEQAFSKKYFKKADIKSIENLNVVRAINTEEQLQFIASEILHLVRDENYRMSDFAVISRQLADCQELVEDVLSAYNIPYFIDNAKNMYHHPLIETILAMLETENEKWQSSSVLRYLKTGLVDTNHEDLDLLENYALANGIKGTYWLKAGEWNKYYVNNINLINSVNDEERLFAEENLSKINQIAENSLESLLKFHYDIKNLDKSQGKYLLSDIIQVINESLEFMQSQEVMESWSRQALDEGKIELSSFHSQILTACQTLLQQLDDFLGDTYVDLAEVYNLIAEGSKNLELNSIPPAVDEILVCDASRTRMSDIRCAFIIDCNEGIFPMTVSEDGLLNSNERDELRNLGLNLSVGQRQLQFAEDYQIYMALTRATDKLYVCYSEFDVNLNILQPSVILENIHSVLPNAKFEKYNKNYGGLRIFSNEALLRELETQISSAKNGKEINNVWWQILKYYKENGMYQKEISALQAGLGYQKDSGRLSLAALQDLYGNIDTTSVSRIEVYNKCPCMYFNRYGLKLQPRQEFIVKPQDIGQIYHSILAEVLQKITEEKIDFCDLNQENILPLVTEALDNYNKSGIGNLFDESNKNQYMRDKIIAVVCQSLLDIAFQMIQGGFRPVAFEVSFGKKSEISGLTLELPDGKKITVHGFIDRIDKAESEEGEYYRIIDYKSSEKDLNLNDIYYGLNWQMPVYLEALLNSKKQKDDKIIKPAGMFYFPIKDIVTSVTNFDGMPKNKIIKLKGLIILDDEAIRLAEYNFFEEKEAKTMDLKLTKNGSFRKNSGIIMNMEYDVVVEYIKKHMTENLQEILMGNIKQRPIIQNDILSCEYCDFCNICLLDNCLGADVCKVEKQSSEDVLHKMEEDIGWYIKEDQEF
jgi:ATP-dependent helicase/nuclease subunit B